MNLPLYVCIIYTDKTNKVKPETYNPGEKAHITIPLIEGNFSPKDAEEQITQVIHAIIQYHQNKLEQSTRAREERTVVEKQIVRLQKELFEACKYLRHHSEKMHLLTEIHFASSKQSKSGI